MNQAELIRVVLQLEMESCVQFNDLQINLFQVMQNLRLEVFNLLTNTGINRRRLTYTASCRKFIDPKISRSFASNFGSIFGSGVKSFVFVIIFITLVRSKSRLMIIFHRNSKCWAPESIETSLRLWHTCIVGFFSFMDTTQPSDVRTSFVKACVFANIITLI